MPPIALTMGDPGGICSEITHAAWEKLRDNASPFFVIAPTNFAKSFGDDAAEISTPEEAQKVFATKLPILPIDEDLDMTLGKSSSANAPAIIKSIERAVKLTLSGAASAVVTNPIQKSTLIAAGFGFPGHTEFLAAITTKNPMPENATRGPVMMLASDMLRAVPVTIHQSVTDAIASLTKEKIIATAQVTHEALLNLFAIENPRIAISGLNPHAGENGALGDEDARIIAPAVEALRENGMNVVGPLPADTMFHEEARAQYDAALCMLHDQALIPAKTLAFHDAVNVTLGLPIIRTSPDHGTALNIAGKGIARPDSLIAAIQLASQFAARRSLS